MGGMVAKEPDYRVFRQDSGFLLMIGSLKNLSCPCRDFVLILEATRASQPVLRSSDNQLYDRRRGMRHFLPERNVGCELIGPENRETLSVFCPRVVIALISRSKAYRKARFGSYCSVE
ncbi:hypothetical protein PoB_003507000 [Plakobranchus ocellatus]|uniref:Uncharacterized protein n=1 Tax=Plakobranchus ocellatus TaxID=259542 RepID=A0AAV4ANW1_9GAST|nr:hypothetical protein PoB_003507000 [Plakobranchus ocellatus]